MESSFQIIKSCILILLFFTNCTKELKIDEVHSDQQLVVEGYIEPNKYPLVYLTKSSAYFNKIDSSNILEYIASYAKVSVSVEGKTEVLTLKDIMIIVIPFSIMKEMKLKVRLVKYIHLK